MIFHLKIVMKPLIKVSYHFVSTFLEKDKDRKFDLFMFEHNVNYQKEAILFPYLRKGHKFKYNQCKYIDCSSIG